MKDAIGYLRVSTQERDRSGLGLAVQRSEIEAFGVHEGFSVVADRRWSGCTAAAKLNDALGQLLVQITCKCWARRIAEPEALARLCGRSARAPKWFHGFAGVGGAGSTRAL
jgi:hypothetical protein